MKKHGVFIIYTIALTLIVALLASMATLLISGAYQVGRGDMVAITKDQYRQLVGYKRLSELERYVDQVYFEESDPQSLLDGAAKGLISSLGDPYSRYYTPSETELMQQAEKGEYAGVGMVFIMDTNDNLMTVTRIYENSPAEAAGAQVGDKVFKVDGEDVTTQDRTYIANKIRGEEGTSVTVTMLRDGEIVELTMTRAIVTVNRVSVRMLDNGIGLVKVDEFEGDVVKGFKSALDTLKKEKATGMIIDLRGNPGGSLTSVVEMCDMILPKGVVVTVKDKAGVTKTYESDAQATSYPLAVIVNGHSASASEIMAAAVQDFAVGEIVGEQTFGKGIVQSYYIFKDDNASLALTSAQYYTPSGRSIHGTGVTPDVAAELSARDDSASMTDENDTQLQAAIESVTRQSEQKARSVAS